jgi:hypothetical protein
MQHEEITCPFCRIQLGAYFEINGEISHMDIMWSPESGLSMKCQQPDITDYIEEIPKQGPIKFKAEFQEKLDQLGEKANTCPDDISKENFDYKDFQYAFINALNWGEIEADDEEYDRSKIEWENVKQMYDEGKSLYEILKTFIVKSE